MKKRASRKPVQARTLKQKWVAERLFHHSGALARTVTTLEQIANAASTLAAERESLIRAVALIKLVNVREHQSISWGLFRNRTK